jgi:hypothetical protein
MITHFASSHFPCLSPIETSLVGLLLKTDCLDISVPLINSQSYEPGESWVASGHCVYRRCLGNERAAAWRHRGLLCSSARCGSAGHGTEQKPLPPIAAQRVFGREAFSGRLPSSAFLRNPTMGWHVTIYIYIYIYIYQSWLNSNIPVVSKNTCLLFRMHPQRSSLHIYQSDKKFE